MKRESIYNAGKSDKFSSFGAQSLKEACMRKAGTDMKRKDVNYLNYLDTMQESINKNI